MNDEFEVKGRLHCTLLGPGGNVKQEWDQPNAIVTQGKTWVASRMAGVSGNTEAVISHMAIGTGTTGTGSLSATALVTQLSRKTASAAYPGGLGGNSVTYTTSFGNTDGAGTITEAGLFNGDGTTATLRFSTGMNVTKAAGDTLIINWTVSLP